jgi:hypothetical protein
MPTVGFEPTIPKIKWPQTIALDSTANGNGAIIIRLINERKM